MIFDALFPKVFTFIARVKIEFDCIFIVTLWKRINWIFLMRFQSTKLTYPSGCSLMRNFFRLKLNLRIFAHENVLIFVIFWKTRIPICATDKFRLTCSWSLAGCILIPYNSTFRAISSRLRSASAGNWPLEMRKKQ